MLLLLRSSKTADVHPSPIRNHGRALAKHLQAPRQQTQSAPVSAAHSLAIRADTRWYSDSPFDVGGIVAAAVAIGGIVKLESTFLGGLKVKPKRARSTMASVPRTEIHPYSRSRSHSHPGAVSARLLAQCRTPGHRLVHNSRFTTPADQP